MLKIQKGPSRGNQKFLISAELGDQNARVEWTMDANQRKQAEAESAIEHRAVWQT